MVNCLPVVRDDRLHPRAGSPTLYGYRLS